MVGTRKLVPQVAHVSVCQQWKLNQKSSPVFNNASDLICIQHAYPRSSNAFGSALMITWPVTKINIEINITVTWRKFQVRSSDADFLHALKMCILVNSGLWRTWSCIFVSQKYSDNPCLQPHKSKLRHHRHTTSACGNSCYHCHRLYSMTDATRTQTHMLHVSCSAV